jgi:hypothetical protein
VYCFLSGDQTNIPLRPDVLAACVASIPVLTDLVSWADNWRKSHKFLFPSEEPAPILPIYELHLPNVAAVYDATKERITHLQAEDLKKIRKELRVQGGIPVLDGPSKEKGTMATHHHRITLATNGTLLALSTCRDELLEAGIPLTDSPTFAILQKACFLLCKQVEDMRVERLQGLRTSSSLVLPVEGHSQLVDDSVLKIWKGDNALSKALRSSASRGGGYGGGYSRGRSGRGASVSSSSSPSAPVQSHQGTFSRSSSGGRRPRGGSTPRGRGGRGRPAAQA